MRIVGNGGVDGNLATVGDNFAFEIGTGLLPGSVLSDGSTMEVPRGVTTMIDAGAIFKLNRARIGVGSSNLNIDRSDAALQVLGTPFAAGCSRQRSALGYGCGGAWQCVLHFMVGRIDWSGYLFTAHNPG